ncbi:MAG: ABC transporter ATP-binding protein [Gammaproteobacteria bacterium]|nr:ABC transporter ATP-binding protein [Gammaproteobacteria bacterium]
MIPLFIVKQALCRIGRHAVLKIDHFEVASGEHWCLFGSNGAGKTLLANLISGKRVESGSYVCYQTGFDPALDIYAVSFEEQQRLWQRDNRLDISEYSDKAEDAGTVVLELIDSARSDAEQDHDLLSELLTQLDLQGVLGKGIRFLSSGQIRRVLIARALYGKRAGACKLLILDDPLESIDKDSRARISHCIEHYLTDDCCSLQLCRRKQDILPGVTHVAVMDELSLLEQGDATAMRAGNAFENIDARRPRIPAKLPPPIADETDDEDAQEPLIVLDNVNAAYGSTPVLSNLSWIMKPWHHVLIEGPNGCGKSTLLSLIDGENHKAYGQAVSLFGRVRGSGETVWEVKARFGIVSNELHNKYVKGWKVLDVVVSGFFNSVGLYDDSGSAEINAARQWLAALGIEALQQHYYHEISFGQQRLALLARAMVKHPRVLILDEPCVGLDDYHRRLILQTLDVIASQLHTNLVYVSHVVGEQPACINQRLRFLPTDVGDYTVEQSAVP